MSPLFPFGPVNYFFGVSGVRPLPYTAATAVGLAPLCMLLAWIGSTFTRLSQAVGGDADIGRTDTIVYSVGLVASVLVVTLLTRATHKALAHELDVDDD